MELAIVKNDYLTEVEKIEIDKQIDNIIERHKGNSFEINRLVFESVTALQTSNSYARELEAQGSVKRFFGMISGKNRNIQSEIDNNLYKSQYSSQQTLQKLAEQNLMSFELITSVNNKLNSSIIEIENEINTIYGTLVTFFKQTKSDLIQIENRLDKLERNVKILNWVNTIEYQMFNGVEYGDLNKIEKIVCLVTDFYNITKGDWTTSDLLLLKSAISEIGLSPKENIKYEEFIRYISENEVLYNKLISEDIRTLDVKKYMDASIINGISKCKLLEYDEKYILKTVVSQIESNGINISDKEAKYSLVNNYVGQTNCIDVKKEVNLFDFIVELLLNIDIFEYIVTEKYICVGIDFDDVEIEIVKRYAEKNNMDAQDYLGDLYYDGERGIEKDYKEAFNWFSKAAEQGNAKAQCDVGAMYYNGDYVAQNYEEAFNWFSKAAKQGNAKAQYNLGVMYDDGKYVEQNYKEVFNWYKKAAEQGNANAQNNLGVMYHDGRYVEQNYEEAFNWYQKAIEQGVCVTQYNIGTMYYNGEYVNKDYKEAEKWIRKAANEGDESAKKFLEKNF